MSESRWVRATVDAVVPIDGRPFVVHKGRAYADTERAVREYPGMFSAAPEVEQVTRAPGERSRVRRAR